MRRGLAGLDPDLGRLARPRKHPADEIAYSHGHSIKGSVVSGLPANSRS